MRISFIKATSGYMRPKLDRHFTHRVMVTYLCGGSPIMTSQISTGRGMVRGDLLKTDPPEDGSDEWDYKDHFAADVAGGDLLGELTVRYIVTIAGSAGNLSKKW